MTDACKNETIHFSPLKLHPINFCPKFGRWPIQCKIIGLEIKTLPDWYKFFRWFLALSRFGPFTFSLMAWQETKKVILINFRLCTMKFFSTNASTSCRIPTVMWKIWFPNVHYKSLNEIHYVPSNEGKIRTEDICYPIFKAAASNLRKCISVLFVKLFYRWCMWACKNETIHFGCR